jgi:hypothetical protein
MSSLSRNAVPLHRNPALRPGLAALATWLMESSYTPNAVGRISDFVAVEGTPTGCPELAAEDEAAATAVFCDGLDAVLPFTVEAWTFDDVFLDARMLADGAHPIPMRPLPPLAGGSPDAAPFEPTAADWDDYSRWSRELEARYAAAEAARTPSAAEVRAWLDANEHDRPALGA